MARKFDDNQKNAINSIKNSVVSAGAGSGKTTVLSERFLNLIQNHGASVDQILTLTFTKKATVEMSDRIYKVLKQKSPKQAAKFSKANIKQSTVTAQALQNFLQGTSESARILFRIKIKYTISPTRLHYRRFLKTVPTVQ